jgi:hypothetical protein
VSENENSVGLKKVVDVSEVQAPVKNEQERKECGNSPPLGLKGVFPVKNVHSRILSAPKSGENSHPAASRRRAIRRKRALCAACCRRV